MNIQYTNIHQSHHSEHADKWARRTSTQTHTFNTHFSMQTQRARTREKKQDVMEEQISDSAEKLKPWSICGGISGTNGEGSVAAAVSAEVHTVFAQHYCFHLHLHWAQSHSHSFIHSPMHMFCIHCNKHERQTVNTGFTTGKITLYYNKESHSIKNPQITSPPSSAVMLPSAHTHTHTHTHTQADVCSTRPVISQHYDDAGSLLHNVCTSCNLSFSFAENVLHISYMLRQYLKTAVSGNEANFIFWWRWWFVCFVGVYLSSEISRTLLFVSVMLVF